MEQFARDYPWTKPPLIACGPMRLIALAPLAVAVSLGGGIGFIGAGNDASQLSATLEEAKQLLAASALHQNNTASDKDNILPIGVGFLLWAGDKLLHDALPALETYCPAAIWLFAPSDRQQLEQWTRETRRVTHGKTKIWIQVGTVADAVHAAVHCEPDVLVVQGQDAGGHGLLSGAGLVPLLPEVDDAVTAACSSNKEQQPKPKPVLVATGGIMDGRGVAASIALGAAGACLGTRYLASPEANIAKGYQDAVLRAADGGVTTERGKLYDSLRGTTDWPLRYGGRGVLNQSYEDAQRGMSFEENKRLHDEALKKGDEGWGTDARLTTYAGTGVGLVKEVKRAAQITEEVREEAKGVLRRVNGTV